MTQLIQRPDYIEYSKDGYEEGWYRAEDTELLENESALFQWEMTHAFLFKISAWKAHLKALSIFCVPYLFCFLYSIYNSINHNRSPWEGNGIFVFFGLLIIFAYSFFYYISRSQYYHIVYKITESGVLRDQVKRYPKFRYRRQDPTKLMNVLRLISIPLIILAIAINPILLVGAAGAIFLSFIPMRVDEPEEALYYPVLWDDSYIPLEERANPNRVPSVNIVEKRKIIHVRNGKGNPVAIICTSENFQQIKELILKKMPNAKREFLTTYR